MGKFNDPELLFPLFDSITNIFLSCGGDGEAYVFCWHYNYKDIAKRYRKWMNTTENYHIMKDFEEKEITNKIVFVRGQESIHFINEHMCDLDTIAGWETIVVRI